MAERMEGGKGGRKEKINEERRKEYNWKEEEVGDDDGIAEHKEEENKDIKHNR